MQRILPVFILSVCGLSFAPVIAALPAILPSILPAIAYRQAASTVGAAIHLQPNMPRAQQLSQVKFMLTQRGGSLILPENCACQMAVYDASNQAIAQNLPLASTSVETRQVIGTTFTFPAPGRYTIVLSGHAKDQSFNSFELIFPAIVRP